MSFIEAVSTYPSDTVASQHYKFLKHRPFILPVFLFPPSVQTSRRIFLRRGSAGHYAHLWEVIVFGSAACGGQITFTTDSWTWKDMKTKSATRLPPSERVSQMSHRWVTDTPAVYGVYSWRIGQCVCMSMYVCGQGGYVSSFLQRSKARRKTWHVNISDCSGFSHLETLFTATGSSCTSLVQPASS